MIFKGIDRDFQNFVETRAADHVGLDIQDRHDHTTDAVFVFDQVSPDYLSELANAVRPEAMKCFQTGKLFLPFNFSRHCSYVIHDSQILHLYHLNSETIRIMHFVFVAESNPEQWVLYGTFDANIKGECTEIRLRIKPKRKLLPMDHVVTVCRDAIVLTYILALPKSHSLETTIIDPQKNLIKRLRGHPPDVAYRRVRIDVAWLKKTKRIGPKGTHASPVGHDRRSHKRRLASGELIDIASSKINGGGQKSGPYTTAIIEQPKT